MPTNWDSIDPLKIITAENILDAVNDEKLVPRENILTMGTPKKAMSMVRMAGTFWFNTSNPYYDAKLRSSLNPTGLQLVAKRDITELRPNIGFEARTITTSSYNALNNFDKANFSSSGYKVSQNSTGSLGSQASNYTIGQQFYYAFHFTNTGTIVTQGNVVFTITIPNGLSCVLSGGQPTVLHLRGGSVITPSTAATLVGNTLTITITASTNPYDVSTNPAAYHISVLMTSYLYSGWNNGTPPPAIVYMPTVSSAYYAVNSPLSSDFYISLNYAALTITKTNPYTGTITFNQEFDYTMRISNASSVSATGVVFTDVLPTGLTFVSITEVPAGWTASISGQTVTVNANANSVVYLGGYFIKIKVRATGENTNISNTASVLGSNSFAASATKTNYIDFKRTPTLTSQAYSTCSSSVTYLVYRDTNALSTTYNQYYVNNVSVGNTAPTNGACSFNGSYTANYYSSGTKNNCTNTCSPTTTVAGSTVVLNNGAGFPTYTTTGTYTSSISQADANAQAKIIADNAFNAGLQAKYNAEGYCTWTASNISKSYSQAFTRNNCGTNCYGNGTVDYGNSQTRSATSTSSCTAAITSAETTAYNAAYAVVQANGQNHANANGTCCCWVADPICSGCNYLGNRERDNCTGAYRNTTPTETSACRCNENCQGTIWAAYCDGTTRKRKKVYNCYPYNDEGTIETVTTCDTTNCGATTSQVAGTTSIGTYFTCANRSVTANLVYKNTNVCYTGTSIYYVSGAWRITDPTNTFPNTTPDYSIFKGIRSYDGNNFNVYENSNACSGYNYLFTNPEPNQPDDVYTNSFGGDEIEFEATRSGGFTRNNCSFGYIGGTVSYSNTYYRGGLLNQDGVDILADANFPADGQDYANATGSCTAQVCKIYDIVALSSGYSVKGNYTLCNGAGGTFNFFANSSGVIGTTPCVNENSVSITESGSGAGIQVGSTC
jgi:uncharacterized repeat protein (TIGR01451 family)